MTDAVLVFDPHGRLIDRNPAARPVLPDRKGDRLGTSMADIFPFCSELAGKLREEGAFRTEASLGQGAVRRTYGASVMPVRAGSEAGARMVLIRDITGASAPRRR